MTYSGRLEVINEAFELASAALTEVEKDSNAYVKLDRVRVLLGNLLTHMERGR